MPQNKDIKKFIKIAEGQGWTISYTKKRHMRWVSPSGEIVICGSTPGDPNTFALLKRDLRARGFIDFERVNKRKKNERTRTETTDSPNQPAAEPSRL